MKTGTRSVIGNLVRALVHDLLTTGAVTGIVRSLLTSQVVSKGADKAKQTVQTSIRTIALVGAAALIFFIGFGFVLAGLYIFLAALIGAAWAGIAIGLGLWVIGFGVILALRLNGKSKESEKKEDQKKEQTAAAGFSSERFLRLFGDAKDLIEKNALLAVAAAFIVGMALAGFPKENNETEDQKD